MNTIIHAIINIVASIPLKYFFGLNWTLIIIFIIAGIVIDIGHLLFFIVKYKKIHPMAWIRIANKMRSKMQPGLYIFHSPEFNVVLMLFSFFNQIIFIVFLSNMAHIILDIIEHYKYHKNMSWIKRWSIIHSLKS